MYHSSFRYVCKSLNESCHNRQTEANGGSAVRSPNHHDATKTQGSRQDRKIVSYTSIIYQ